MFPYQRIILLFVHVTSYRTKNKFTRENAFTDVFYKKRYLQKFKFHRMIKHGDATRWDARVEEGFHVRIVRSFVIIFHGRGAWSVIARSGEIRRVTHLRARNVFRSRNRAARSVRSFAEVPVCGTTAVFRNPVSRGERSARRDREKAAVRDERRRMSLWTRSAGGRAGARPRDRRARRAIGRGRASLSLLTRCFSLACFRHRHPTVSATGVWLRGSE